MRIEIGDIYLAAYLELQGERLVEVRLRVAPYDVLRGVFVFEEDPACPIYRIRNLDLTTREIRELPE